MGYVAYYYYTACLSLNIVVDGAGAPAEHPYAPSYTVGIAVYGAGTSIEEAGMWAISS